MLIDWFTVAAQAVNFLILVWLLKHFLYQPILDAIDAREKRIAAELADADARKAEARKERDAFRQRNDEFDRQRAALLSQATVDAKAERQRLLNEARSEADALSTKRQEALKREQQGLNDEITRRTREEVFAITRKTLRDLAGTSLEKRMSEEFSRRLRTLNADAKEDIAEALSTASDPALVRSAFDLPAEQRAAIQQALNETFADEIQVRFETAPEVISGIELTANGRKVAWSIADYLSALENRVGELLMKPSRPGTRPKSGAQPGAPAETK